MLHIKLASCFPILNFCECDLQPTFNMRLTENLYQWIKSPHVMHDMLHFINTGASNLMTAMKVTKRHWGRDCHQLSCDFLSVVCGF